MKTWFTITNKADAPSAEIDIFDEIGLWGVSVKDFSDQLKALAGDRAITLRINSPGGSIVDGFAMFNMLKARREHITAKVIGLAASMATVVMLAAKSVVASENSLLMIHNPASIAWGESKDMREMADLLDKMKSQLVNTYVAKTGKTEAEVVAAMDAVTWFTAKEAKEWGLIDAISDPVKATAVFDLTRFGTVPQNISGGQTASAKPTNEIKIMKNLLKALADANLIASADVSEEIAVTQLTASLATQKTKLTDLENKVTAALNAEADACVSAAVKSGKIKEDKELRAKWVSAYVRDAVSTKALIDSLPEAKGSKGVAPIAVAQGADAAAAIDARPSTHSVWAKQFNK